MFSSALWSFPRFFSSDQQTSIQRENDLRGQGSSAFVGFSCQGEPREPILSCLGAIQPKSLCRASNSVGCTGSKAAYKPCKGKSHGMSTVLLCCVICILMLSVLLQSFPYATPDCGYQHTSGVETCRSDSCRHTGCSSVANAVISIQHGHQQVSTCRGFAHNRHHKQQGGLSLLPCVACQTLVIERA